MPVDLGERSYDVVVGPGARFELPGRIPPASRQVAVVTQEGLDIELDLDLEHHLVVIGRGEEAKSLSTIEHICRRFSQLGLSRTDAVVAVGGGVVTDTAGFAAAVYHRGVAVLHVPTTLLAQVDAAVGGKTGVNLPEGKNLVGAFWQPTAVLCDTELLSSLPEEEWRSGLGEVAKYHFLDRPGGPVPAAALDDLALDERIAECVRIKAAVVAADERESELRAVLNYGHTLAHALETAGTYELRHGEAVAIGLVFAAELARLMGRIDDARVALHRRVVSGYALPTALPLGMARSQLLALMARDKKASGGLTFVLDGPGGVEVVRDVDPVLVEEALELIS